MRTHQIVLAALTATLFLFTACEEPGTTVPKGEYDNLMQEYRELKAGTEALREEHAAQAVAIDNILQELSQLSGRTVLLRSEIESGTVQLTQVEQIEENISDLKQKLSELDKLARQSAELQKMVKSLKTVIAEKEAEIDQLKEQIRIKDATIDEQHRTIAEQHGTIESQNATISSQQENLRALLAEQAQMLFQAGVDFENLGDEAPEVHGRRDKQEIKAFREEMYGKALLYYREAADAGYPQASYRISQVEAKKAGL